jgi:MFS-type transporter involved in bile tolerance (Atg22 family)
LVTLVLCPSLRAHVKRETVDVIAQAAAASDVAAAATLLLLLLLLLLVVTLDSEYDGVVDYK